jgi:hypothetical protein
MRLDAMDDGQVYPSYSAYGPMLCQVVIPGELARPYREDTVPNLQRVVSLAGALLAAGVSIDEVLRRLTLQEDL